MGVIFTATISAEFVCDIGGCGDELVLYSEDESHDFFAEVRESGWKIGTTDDPATTAVMCESCASFDWG